MCSNAREQMYIMGAVHNSEFVDLKQVIFLLFFKNTFGFLVF